MKVIINEYYVNHMDNIIGILNQSIAGKRIWYTDVVTGYNDYSATQRSTFPYWLSFWFVKTPKSKRVDYLEEGKEAFLDGYYNGSPRDLRNILDRCKKTGVSSYKSKRVQEAFSIICKGYMAEELYKLKQEECDKWEYS
jgi:hypothetical protein